MDKAEINGKVKKPTVKVKPTVMLANHDFGLFTRERQIAELGYAE